MEMDKLTLLILLHTIKREYDSYRSNPQRSISCVYVLCTDDKNLI